MVTIKNINISIKKHENKECCEKKKDKESLVTRLLDQCKSSLGQTKV